MCQNLISEQSWCQDTFPEITEEVKVSEDLTEAIQEVCQQKYIDCYPYFEDKIKQLYQMIRSEEIRLI